MKIFIKIEAGFNKVAFLAGSAIVKYWIKITPPTFRQKIVDRYHLVDQKIQTRKNHFKNKFLTIKEHIKNKFASKAPAKDSFKEVLAKIKLILKNQLSKIKQLKKSDLKKIRGWLNLKLSNTYHWYTPKQWLARLSLTGLALTCVAIVIYNSMDIVNKAGYRQPASLPPIPFDVRANYHNIEKKYYEIPAINLPINSTKAGDSNSMDIDLIIQTTNRTTILFFQKNEAQLLDHLYSNISNFDPKFIMTLEGRAILISKIETEFNVKLEKMNAPGKVEKVYIKEILGD